MKKAVAVFVFLLLLLIIPPLAQAQPQPPSVATLGPPIICSEGDSGTYVKIVSPQNQSYSSNPVQLNFEVSAVGMFGQFGNVGYSLDGGVIKSVTEFSNKTVEFAGPDWYWNRTTVLASVVLPALTEGAHNATVYYGWQYLGTNNPQLERYEVYAYATVDFVVGNPAITPPAISISSPEYNSTAEDKSIQLVFNVSAPVALNAMQSDLGYVYYVADWLSEKQYVYLQNVSSDEHFESLELNITLSSIPVGTHELLIVVGGSVAVRQGMFVEEFGSESNSTVVFNVNSSVQPFGILALSRTQIVSIFVLASIAATTGLLVYFKKRAWRVGNQT